MRLSDISRSAVIVLCLLGCNIWKAVTEALREDSDSKEVALKVHLSDASTHQPLSDATVEVFANYTPVARETSGSDGNIFIRFPYRLGDLLVITATKRGYVPNSAPWRPARLPVFSSLSLDLLPERAATLMVYDDEVQIVSGYQGSRLQPWIQFQRRALSLPPNTTYTNLTAFLTVTHSGQNTQHFPYLQGLGSNSTGSNRRFELTPVAAISVHLLGSDGAELLVNEPISVSVPLPANCGLKENDHIPAWRFDPKLGAWLKSSLGYVQREGGGELILTYIASQLGYWVAAMSPINTGPVVAKDISTYHTVFLLAILGGMALILLFLLCLLLCYCRRKCSRSRRAHQKYTLTSSLDSSKRDQATSMSHLNLINEVQLDHVGVEPDLHTPMLKAAPRDSSTNELVSSRNVFGSHSQRDYHRSYSSVVSSTVHPLHTSALSSSPYLLHHAASAGRLSSESKASPRELRLSPSTTSPTTSPERDLGADHRPSDFLLSRSVDQLERPPGLLPGPGALLCCTSELQVSQAGAGYQKGRPTLLIPAHYMRLPGTHPLSGQALLLQSDERSELESIRAELNASHQPQTEAGEVGDRTDEGVEEGKAGLREAGGGTVDEWSAALPEALSIPNSLSEAALGVVQMNGEDQLLAEKTLMELRGGKPLPHPRAWFVSLDGRSNAHIRHSYIDLQRAAHGINSVGSNDASLDSGVDVSDLTPGRKAKVQEKAPVMSPNVACTSLVFVEANSNANAHSEPNESKSQTPACSPEENSLVPLLPKSETEEETIMPPSPPLLPTPPLPSPPPLPDPAIEEEDESRGDKEQIVRTERAQTHLNLPSSNSAPDGLAAPEDIDENKKSPWQKREERPLLAFNLK
ncbi:protein FAM171A1 isoform X1 [Hemibagrus wyckioides]|uniref:protein FAM171A1 isoform X1 n=1 Tax=Hemibagrus wyckioides TaxID=337641 RepID=UPI00266D6C3B|nr:protein FAM171A1 isoform X1 [Hemibagrus wyckioides]